MQMCTPTFVLREANFFGSSITEDYIMQICIWMNFKRSVFMHICLYYVWHKYCLVKTISGETDRYLCYLQWLVILLIEIAAGEVKVFRLSF